MNAAERLELDPTLEHHIFSLDFVVHYISCYLLSPLVWIGIWLGSALGSGNGVSSVQLRSVPGYVAATIILIRALRRANRLYAAAGSWFWLPRRISNKGCVSWVDQIVLITGGGSGIGALLAEVLADRGATVVVLTKFPPEYKARRENLKTYLCDVSDWKAVESIAAKVQEEVGHPTIIVNNAGVVKGKLLLDLTEEDVTDTFGANTLAHFWILKAFLPAMIKRGRGHIVSVASILGIVATAQMSDYCASKAAAISLHQSLRQELDNRYKARRIRTSLILPHHVTTSLFSSIHLPSRGLLGFIAPSLTPTMVVRAIIAALDSDESNIVRLPAYTQLLRFWGPAVGMIPKPIADLVQWTVGADTAMREYGPRPDAAERLRVEMVAERARL